MIPVQNIYYMLSYAFQALQAQNYKDLATVKFHNTAELCAAILDKGISVQLKRGLGRDYLPKSESLSTLQGKLNISESIKTQTLLKKQMICTYDEFSTNTQFNQIIKSTLLLLLKANITNTRKKSLRNLLLFFSDVSEIDLRFVNWSQHYNRLFKYQSQLPQTPCQSLHPYIHNTSSSLLSRLWTVQMNSPAHTLLPAYQNLHPYDLPQMLHLLH